MEIGNQGSDVTSAVGTTCSRVFFFDIVEILFGSIVELCIRTFIDGVIFSAFRGGDIFVRKKKLSNGGIVGKTVNTMSGCIKSSLNTTT